MEVIAGVLHPATGTVAYRAVISGTAQLVEGWGQECNLTFGLWHSVKLPLCCLSFPSAACR